MPNTSVLTPDVNKGETNDTPKKFKNIDTEDFEFSWDSVKTIVLAGQTIDLPLYKVNYAAMHLARKIYKRKIFEGKTEAERSVGILRFVNAEEEMKLMKQMVADNFETIPETPIFPKAPEIIPEKPPETPEPTPNPITTTEEKKEEEEKKPEEVSFKCEVCGFVAKSSLGLLAHKRFKHK